MVLVMCIGEWEHFYCVKIDTLYSPGWIVQIDVLDTKLENKPSQTKDNYVNDNNWLYCQMKNNKFCSSGEQFKLKVILEIFRSQVE